MEDGMAGASENDRVPRGADLGQAKSRYPANRSPVS